MLKDLLEELAVLVILVLAVLFTAFYAFGQSITFEWKQGGIDDRTRFYLYKHGVQIGGWDTKEKYFRPYKDGQWGARSCMPSKDLPLPPGMPESSRRECICDPCLCEKCFCQEGNELYKGDWRTHGVFQKGDSLNLGYTINGKCVPKEEALQSLTMDDDSQKLWLVVIGPESSRKKVLADIDSNPSLSDLKSHTRIWSVPKDHFSLMDRVTNQPMYDVTGDPSVVLMSPVGEVLYQNAFYDAEDIRKADPNFKNNPSNPDAKQAMMMPCVTLILLAVLLYLLLSRKDN